MRSFFAAGLFLLLLLAGCTIGKTVAPVEIRGFPSPQAALEAIKPIEDTDTLYQITAKVSASSPQGKLNFRLAVIMQSPDKLRIESIPILGPPDFMLAMQGERFQVYLPGNQEWITGNATPANLARFLPLSWSVERWMAMLRGYGPAVFAGPASVQGKMEGLFYRVDALSEGAVVESLWINPVGKRLEKTERLVSGRLKETVLFTAFREINGRDFPGAIRIETGEGKTIGIVYQTIETAKEIPDDLFSLLPPPDAVITNLPE